MFDNESQIIRKFNFDFWPNFDKEFQSLVLQEMFTALSEGQSNTSRETYILTDDAKDLKPFLFRFMLNYLLEKCRHSLHELLDDFLL